MSWTTSCQIRYEVVSLVSTTIAAAVILYLYVDNNVQVWRGNRPRKIEGGQYQRSRRWKRTTAMSGNTRM